MGLWEYSDIIGYSILLIYIYVYICIGNMVLLHLTSKLVPGSKHNIYRYDHLFSIQYWTSFRFMYKFLLMD